MSMVMVHAVAGTAAAAGNNATGVASIAWNAQIMPIRITNRSDGYAYWSDAARGLSWAADNGAHVANISYGMTNSSTVSSAAQYMRSKGGLVVVAGGNHGTIPATQTTHTSLLFLQPPVMIAKPAGPIMATLSMSAHRVPLF